MLMPTYRTMRQRSILIRKAHRARCRELAKELRRLLGKNYESPLDPLPCRMAKLPTDEELKEYW